MNMRRNFNNMKNKERKFLKGDSMPELNRKIRDHVERGWKVISDVKEYHGRFSRYEVLVEYIKGEGELRG